MLCGGDLIKTNQGPVGEPTSPDAVDVARCSLTRLDLAATSLRNSDELGAFAVRPALVEPAEYKLELKCTPESKNVQYSVQKSDFLGLATVTAPAWEDAERAPIDVICVLDKSSSMSGKPISLLRKSTRRLVKSLGPKDRVCLIEFGSYVRTTLPFTRMDNHGKEKAKKIIKQLFADGMTALCGGLVEALKVAQNRGADANDICSILLFTDGEANVGTEDVPGILREARAVMGLDEQATPGSPPVDLDGEPEKWTNAQCIQWLKNIKLDLPAYVKTFLENKIDGDILINDVDKDTVSDVLHIGSLHAGKFWRELIRLREPDSSEEPGAREGEEEEGMNKEGKEEPTQEGDETSGKAVITVNTFGFGVNHNEKLLDQLASEFDGMFFFMKDESIIVEAFAACMGGLMSTVAQKMMLSFECKNGATGLEILDKEKDKVITRVAGHHLVFNAGDIQQEENRAVLVKFKIPKSRSAMDDPQDYLSVKLTYENLIAKNDQALEVTVRTTRTTAITSRRNIEVDTEYNRVLCAAALDRSAKIADATHGSDLSRARRVVTDCMETIINSVSGKAKVKMTQDMLKDLRTTLEGLKDRQTYRSWGSKEIRSSSRTMSRQRCISSNTARHSTQSHYMTPTKRVSMNSYSRSDSDDSDEDTRQASRSAAYRGSSPNRSKTYTGHSAPSYLARLHKKKKKAARRKTALSKGTKTKKLPSRTIIKRIASGPSSAPAMTAPLPNRPGRLDTILSQVALDPVAKADDISSEENKIPEAPASSTL